MLEGNIFIQIHTFFAWHLSCVAVRFILLVEKKRAIVIVSEEGWLRPPIIP